MAKQALVLLADGCEETEAVTVIDLLTRAGITVSYANITEELIVNCSRGVKILAEPFSAVADKQFDVLVLPGGLKGAEHFRDSTVVIDKLQQAKQQGSLIAGICATPALVFAHHRLFPGAKMTGYPTTRQALSDFQDARVYYDANHNLLTSQGPGTSIDFALAIIAQLLGETAAKNVAEQLVLATGIDDYR